MSVHGSEIEDKASTASEPPLTPLPSFQPRSIVRAWSWQLKQRRTAGLGPAVVSLDWDYGGKRPTEVTPEMCRLPMHEEGCLPGRLLEGLDVVPETIRRITPILHR